MIREINDSKEIVRLNGFWRPRIASAVKDAHVNRVCMHDEVV